jgi:type VI secretion system protein ImpF
MSLHELDAQGRGTRVWSSDRLQPTLLDRLTDDRPTQAKDTVGELVISRRQLRQIILRDLAWLLNATKAESEMDFSFNDDAKRSTINYGLPAFSGRRASDVKLGELELEIKDAIALFEPRIVPSTLQVTAEGETDSMSAHNLVVFQIRGQIWATPYPIEMLLKSSMDLETGAVTLLDQLGDA